MFRRKFLIVSYIMTLMTSSLYIEASTRPVEYLTEVYKRIKRSSTDFHRAIMCFQPDIIILGVYGNYGCYCGISGAGKAIDDTDRCCADHDKCYDEAGTLPKSSWESFILIGSYFFQSYKMTCTEGEIVCAKNSPYKDKLCSCDKEAAECFHRSSATYHPQLVGIDNRKYCVPGADFTDLNLTSFENRYKPVKKKNYGSNDDVIDEKYHQIKVMNVSDVTIVEDNDSEGFDVIIKDDDKKVVDDKNEDNDVIHQNKKSEKEIIIEPKIVELKEKDFGDVIENVDDVDGKKKHADLMTSLSETNVTSSRKSRRKNKTKRQKEDKLVSQSTLHTTVTTPVPAIQNSTAIFPTKTTFKLETVSLSGKTRNEFAPATTTTSNLDETTTSTILNDVLSPKLGEVATENEGNNGSAENKMIEKENDRKKEDFERIDVQNIIIPKVILAQRQYNASESDRDSRTNGKEDKHDDGGSGTKLSFNLLQVWCFGLFVALSLVS